MRNRGKKTCLADFAFCWIYCAHLQRLVLSLLKPGAGAVSFGISLNTCMSILEQFSFIFRARSPPTTFTIQLHLMRANEATDCIITSQISKSDANFTDIVGINLLKRAM